MQPITATVETTVDVPVGPGVYVYDLPVEVELESEGDGWRIATVSLDAFSDAGVSRPGKRWSYVEIGRWLPGAGLPVEPYRRSGNARAKLAWHLARGIAEVLRTSSGFDAKARTALCIAYDGERAQHAIDKWKAARDDRAAAE